MAKPYFFILILSLFPNLWLFGSEEELFHLPPLEQPIEFDGVCNEVAWQAIDPLPVYMFRPNHGQQPSEKTEIYVTYDREYFYMAGRFYYKNGAKIIAKSKKRDPIDSGNDYFGILLDTFNDNENAVCFETSPVGLRSDFSISNDAESNMGTRPFNRSWNTFWDVKTAIIEGVWHTEMRIPLSSLRFQDKNGRVVMGMTVWRKISSRQENAVFPLMTNEFGSFSIWKPSQAKKIVLENVYRKNPVFITPYVLTGAERTHEINEEQTAYVQQDDYKLNAGIDIKYGITSNMTMDLTINTDFAQVEVDDQMVNLTRFSLFFPEKRQFFLERSSIFEIKTGYTDQLFYSRRIGLYEGEIIPIIAGARVVGRAGKWDLGAMSMQTSAHDYIDEDTDEPGWLESTNHSVFRLRRQVFNPRSYVGGMITNQIDVKGNYNTNAALDGIFNPFRNDYITANYIQTFDSDVGYNHNWFDHSKFNFNWENRTNVGFIYNVRGSRAGKYYNPEMGFELMEDYTRAYTELGYGWIFDEPFKKMLSHRIFSWVWLNKRNEDLKTDIFKASLGWTFSLKKGYRASFNFTHNYDYLDEIFEVTDDLYFPVGAYSYNLMEGYFGTPSNNLISLRARWEVGQYYDGRIATLGPTTLTFRPSSTVQLGFDYQYSYIDVSDRNHKLTAHLARLKTEFTFTTKLSLSMFFQYSSKDSFGINNVRFRYNPKEGNDLYIVYNDEYNTHRYREIPTLPTSDIRSLIIKYTYTFIVRK